MTTAKNEVFIGLLLENCYLVGESKFGEKENISWWGDEQILNWWVVSTK